MGVCSCLVCVLILFALLVCFLVLVLFSGVFSFVFALLLAWIRCGGGVVVVGVVADGKSTRLNASHGYISDAAFCLKKKNR